MHRVPDPYSQEVSSPHPNPQVFSALIPSFYEMTISGSNLKQMREETCGKKARTLNTTKKIKIEVFTSTVTYFPTKLYLLLFPVFWSRNGNEFFQANRFCQKRKILKFPRISLWGGKCVYFQMFISTKWLSCIFRKNFAININNLKP